MNVVVAALVAIIVHDGANLRAAAEVSAPRQAVLHRGDWLEVRGRHGDWLKVYDHRRERPGFVKAYLARSYELDPERAIELRALYRFHRDMPGGESLGIGFAALFLRAADPATIDADVFDAIGTMARRLAKRASGRGLRVGDKMIVSHLDVARSYGIKFDVFENAEGRGVTCYDGEAFARVLSMAAPPSAKARAVLALADARCDPPHLSPAVEIERAQLRVSQLAKLDPTAVSPEVGNQVRLRLAELSARLAFHYARRGLEPKARSASETALAMYQRVDKAHLDQGSRRRYRLVGIAVGATKWARARKTAVPNSIRLSQTDTGQTCVNVIRKKRSVFERCTHGLVWKDSIRVSPDRRTVVVAVQPLPSWSELWVLRKTRGGWTADALIPAAANPTRGFVEWAGFSRRGDTMVVAREAEVDGRLRRKFQAIELDSLTVRLSASSLRRFATFKRHRAREWSLGGRSGG